MTFICGGQQAPEQAIRVLAGLRDCCLGAFEDGPSECTCWEPEYDLEQQPPQKDHPSARNPSTMAAPCGDCAFRPDSPERQGDDRYAHAADLDELDHFWCHTGMRKPVRWRHRLGVVVECDTDAYTPPVIKGVPFRADGTPGQRCAGFEARKRAAKADV